MCRLRGDLRSWSSSSSALITGVSQEQRERQRKEAEEKRKKQVGGAQVSLNMHREANEYDMEG